MSDISSPKAKGACIDEAANAKEVPSPIAEPVNSCKWIRPEPLISATACSVLTDAGKALSDTTGELSDPI